MSNVPPEEPMTPPPPPPPPSAYSGLGRVPTTGAILPVPGNAELAIYVLATVLLAIICAASDRVDIAAFSTYFFGLTAAYIISRGIAKASRVLEQ
jgi:hypothetical protein